MAKEDAKLREEIQFLTSLINAHKTNNAVQQQSSDTYIKQPRSRSVEKQTETTGIPKPGISQEQIILPWRSRLTPSKSLPSSLNRCTNSTATDQYRWVAQSSGAGTTPPSLSPQCSTQPTLRKSDVNSEISNLRAPVAHVAARHPASFLVGSLSPSESVSPAKVVSVSKALGQGCSIRSKYKIVKSRTQPTSVPSPVVSPVKYQKQPQSSRSSLVFGKNPRFVGTPNSITSPSRKAITGFYTSTPKESSTLFQSKYKLVKLGSPATATLLKVRHNHLKLGCKASKTSSAGQSQTRTRLSRSRILPQYKYVRWNWDPSKIHSSNRLLKKAVVHARKRMLPDMRLQMKSRRPLSVFKVDNTEKDSGRGITQGKTPAKTWMKKYSLRRENSGMPSFPLMNQLLGRSVTNISSNKYKFIKGSSSRNRRQSANRFKVCNKSPLRRMLWVEKAPMLSRSKLKLDRRRYMGASSRHQSTSMFRYRPPIRSTLYRLQHSASSSVCDSSSPGRSSRFQLCRSSFTPKSSSQIRAGSAVRRSVYTAATARLRHQQAFRQHCLYYNRFGRCNRGNRCPNIHDPERVAVCTRFLRGTCQITNCSFSHKVSAEKMPVCSFFLRGVCNRDSCPYLHVSVGKDAELCQDFAKGFCPLGEKCKKKHLLICPDFKRDGRCPRGKECFLKHPARRAVTTSRKDTSLKRPVEARRRMPTVVKKPETAKDWDDVNLPWKERNLASFIALETSDSQQAAGSDASPATRPPPPSQGMKNGGIFPSFLPQGK